MSAMPSLHILILSLPHTEPIHSLIGAFLQPVSPGMKTQARHNSSQQDTNVNKTSLSPPLMDPVGFWGKVD